MRLAMLSALMMSATLMAAPEPSADEALFLNPYLKSELASVSGSIVLDAGCGATPYAIEAAQNGATVCAVDAEPALLEKTQIAIAQAGVKKQVHLAQADVENLPYEAACFDRALSVNIGCNLERTMQTISQDHYSVSGLGGHFREVARVLKEGGQLFVAAPASLDVVFTDGKHSQEMVLAHIETVLEQIGSSNDPEVIKSRLGELQEVQRATFVQREGKLALVTDVKELTSGETIWRKNPESVEKNYYHSEEEYLVAINNAGLQCEEIKRPCFFGSLKYKTYRKENDALGEAYMDNHPFTIYYVKKQEGTL